MRKIFIFAFFLCVSEVEGISRVKASNTAIELIKKHESFCANVYRCPAGKLTIGYGHTGEGVKLGKVSEAKATELLKSDVSSAENAINKFVKTELNQNQFDALVSFVFNVGNGNFKKSTLLEQINERHFVTAAEQFNKWVFAGKEKLPGLVKRRQEEKALFLKT